MGGILSDGGGAALSRLRLRRAGPQRVCRGVWLGLRRLGVGGSAQALARLFCRPLFFRQPFDRSRHNAWNKETCPNPSRGDARHDARTAPHFVP